MHSSFEEALLLLKKWKDSRAVIHMLDVTASTWFTGKVAELSEEVVVISNGGPVTRFRVIKPLSEGSFQYEDSREIRGTSVRYECSLIVTMSSGHQFILSETASGEDERGEETS